MEGPILEDETPLLPRLPGRLGQFPALRPQRQSVYRQNGRPVRAPTAGGEVLRRRQQDKPASNLPLRLERVDGGSFPPAGRGVWVFVSGGAEATVYQMNP